MTTIRFSSSPKVLNQQLQLKHTACHKASPRPYSFTWKKPLKEHDTEKAFMLQMLDLAVLNGADLLLFPSAWL